MLEAIREVKKQFPEFDGGQQQELARYHSRAVYEAFEAAGRAQDKEDRGTLEELRRDGYM